MSTALDDLGLDIDITVSGPEDYADNTPAPLPMGTYEFLVREWELDTKGKTPCVVLKRIEVTGDNPQAGRTIGFVRVYPTPFMRKDRNGEEKKVSQLADFCRSLDAVEGVMAVNGGFGEVARFLNRAIDEKITFRASVTWEAFDQDYYDAQAELRSIAKGDYKSPEAKALRKEATLKGKKGFADGKPTQIGPSGKSLDARAVINNFFEKRQD